MTEPPTILGTKSPQLAKAIFRLVEITTLLPFTRFTSRLLGRSLIAAEEGEYRDF